VRRRDLIYGTAVAMAAWRAGAQEALKSARIGFIVTGEAWPRRHFDDAMRQLGWVEGRNLSVERRITGEDTAARKTDAAELVAAKPDVIVAAGTRDAQTVHALTRTIPIVVIRGQDLVEEGLADSLAHPGGNVTGIVLRGEELDGKRLQLLRELIPAAKQISVLGYTRGPRSVPRAAAVEDLARPLGMRVAAAGEPSGRTCWRLRRQCGRPRPGDPRAGQLAHIRESAHTGRARRSISLAGNLSTARIR